MAASNILTLGQTAQPLGVRTWQVDALYRRGLLPTPARVGQLRVINEDDLPMVRGALERAGYARCLRPCWSREQVGRGSKLPL